MNIKNINNNYNKSTDSYLLGHVLKLYDHSMYPLDFNANSVHATDMLYNVQRLQINEDHYLKGGDEC